jgi:hypothetical protein
LKRGDPQRQAARRISTMPSSSRPTCLRRRDHPSFKIANGTDRIRALTVVVTGVVRRNSRTCRSPSIDGLDSDHPGPREIGAACYAVHATNVACDSQASHVPHIGRGTRDKVTVQYDGSEDGGPLSSLGATTSSKRMASGLGISTQPTPVPSTSSR